MKQIIISLVLTSLAFTSSALASADSSTGGFSVQGFGSLFKTDLTANQLAEADLWRNALAECKPGIAVRLTKIEYSTRYSSPCAYCTDEEFGSRRRVVSEARFICN